MPAPIVIDFLMRGMPELSRALRTIEQAALASSRTQTTAAQRESRARVSIVDREARDKVRAMVKADTETKRILERAARETEKLAKQRTKAEEREMRLMVREAEKAANARLQIERRVDREFAAMQKRQAAERDKIIRDDERRQEQSALRIQRIRDRSATMAGRHAAREAATEGRSRDAFRQRFSQAAFGGVANGARLIGSGVSAAAGMVSQLGGGFGIADSVARQGSLERAAIHLSNSAFIPGQTQRVDPQAIMNRARAASITTGMDAQDLVEATKAYVAKSADMSGGMANMGFFGQIAKATDTSVQDIAKTAGILRVQNKNLDEKAMKQMLLDVIMQGKQGSVEFEDLAGIAGKVTRSAAGYGGTQADNQRKLLGLAQIAIRTSGSPEEAATVLSNISADASKHAGTVKGVLGEKAFNERGQIAKGPDEFIADVMEKTGGNLMKIQAMGFGARSMKMFQALAPTFNEAMDAAGGGEAGRRAGRKAIESDMGAVVGASYSEQHLSEDLKRVLGSGAEQYERAMRDLRDAVGQQLAPELIKLVPVLRDLLPALTSSLRVFVNFAEWGANNPLAGIGAVMAASVAKSVAEAGLKSILEKAVMQSLGTGGGLTVAGATIAIAGTIAAISIISQQQANQVSDDVNKSNAGVTAAAGTRLGDKTTSDELAALQAQRDAMQAKVAEQRAGVNSKEAIEYVGLLGRAAAITPIGYGARKLTGNEGVMDEMDQSAAYQKSRDDRLKQSEEALMKLNQAILIAEQNLRNLGKDGPGGGPPGGGPGGKPVAATTGIGQRVK